MNILGIGTPEMLVIMVAALIIFGPGKLPEVMGQVGKAVRDFRRMSAELTGELEKTVGDVGDIRKTVANELSGVKSQVAGVGQSVKQDVTATASTVTAASGSGAKPATSTVQSAARPAPAGMLTPAVAAAAPVVNGSTATAVTRASKADPLADVSFMDGDAAPVAAMPAATPAGTSRGAATSANGHTAPPVELGGDALSRARQRRLQASYNRR